MSQNKLKGRKERSHLPHLCEEKDKKCTFVILFLFVFLPKIPEHK